MADDHLHLDIGYTTVTPRGASFADASGQVAFGEELRDRHRAGDSAQEPLGLALVNGVVLQALIDPERAPSGRDVAAAVRAVVLTA